MTALPYFKFTLSVLLGLWLSLTAMPGSSAIARPLWLPMLLVYWSLREPRLPSVALAFGLGLLTDVLMSAPLGQYGLGYLLLVAISHRLRTLVALLPAWQVMLLLIPLWALHTVLMFWIDGLNRHSSEPSYRWWPVLSTALAWPLLCGLMDHWRQRRRDDNSAFY